MIMVFFYYYNLWWLAIRIIHMVGYHRFLVLIWIVDRLAHLCSACLNILLAELLGLGLMLLGLRVISIRIVIRSSTARLSGIRHSS